MPEPAADPMASEDEFYAAIVSEYRGLRRAGAGVIEAASLAAAHLVFLTKANEA
jgi:hypothetical protein